MSIGTTIRRLRRERDITQEQLAEYLGISSSAVSQWECDKSCPDVLQLPILSNIFNVTTDEILSVNIESKEKRIAEISGKARELSDNGKGGEAETVLKSGLRDYPDSCKLMEQLSSTLYSNAYSCGADRERLLEESLALAEKVINECADIQIKSEAIRTAVYVYKDRGMLAEAEKCAFKLPDLTRSNLLAAIYKGEKLAELYRDTMIESQLTNALFFARLLADLCDDSGCALFTDEEKLKIHQKILDVYKIMYEDEDFDFFSQFLAQSNEEMARIYAKSGDEDKVIMHLKDAAKYAVMFETYDWEHEKTSLLFRGLKNGGWVRRTPDAASGVVTGLQESMSEDIFDFVRNDKRFKDICDTLRKVTDR